jgi:hypothetical protein
MAWLPSAACTLKPRRASTAASIPAPQAASSTSPPGPTRASRHAVAGWWTAAPPAARRRRISTRSRPRGRDTDQPRGPASQAMPVTRLAVRLGRIRSADPNRRLVTGPAGNGGYRTCWPIALYRQFFGPCDMCFLAESATQASRLCASAPTRAASGHHGTTAQLSHPGEELAEERLFLGPDDLHRAPEHGPCLRLRLVQRRVG